MKFKMNKKADISITLLVLGIVAIIFLTIFSFIKENNDRSDGFSGIGLIETMNSVQEELALPGFETDYGNKFKRNGIQVNMTERGLVGGYYKEECTTFGFINCQVKRKVFVQPSLR